MAAIMIVLMRIDDPSWMESYVERVPSLLAEYGATAIAAARHVEQLEGDLAIPDRVAVLGFPDLATLHRFMRDDRYAPFKAAREAGSRSTILAMTNELSTDQPFA